MNHDFYITGDADCSYLPNRSERKLFTRLERDDGMESVKYASFLMDNGFRRDQNYFYRPECRLCSACKSVRVQVSSFRPDRTQRKIYNRLDGGIYVSVADGATDEHFALYQKYEQSRHSDSEMVKMSFDEFCRMIENSPIETHLYEFRSKETNELRAAMLVDHVVLGLSAVYSFFDVGKPKESLGTYMIVKMIEWCRELSLPYFYLGYYIAECRKMNYKNKFKPFEVFDFSGFPAKTGKWRTADF